MGPSLPGAHPWLSERLLQSTVFWALQVLMAQARQGTSAEGHWALLTAEESIEAFFLVIITLPVQAKKTIKHL